MMMPASSFSSSSSSSSSGSATLRVEKATSEFLIGPDWTMNINICDTINTNHWLAKDVVKALKKRLQHKNPNVHLLSLTLLETMVKNCGDYVHSQIVERNILQDMIKIVKKKTDMRVREKILVLLDSWQQAFGGPGGKYPQYYWAYEELRRSGVEFPQRTADSALIFTPPVTHPAVRHAQAGYGMPRNSSTRLDEAMASEIETLSLSSISSMREVLDLFSAMLQAVDPNDRTTVKDEVIVDLVDRCRSNQKKLMHMLTTTGDEELLGQGLELNDNIQNELAKHDAIASGSPLLAVVTNSKPQLTDVPDSSPKPTKASVPSSEPSAVPSSPLSVTESRHPVEEEDEEEDDDFAQLARRHSKTQSPASQGTYVGTTETVASPSNALALSSPPEPVKTGKDQNQDIIDLLSLTLTTTTPTSPPRTPSSSSTQNVHRPTVSPISQGYQPYASSQNYPGNQGQVPFNGYVAPWAQPQPQQQSWAQAQAPAPAQAQPLSQFQTQPQYQPQAHLSSGYPPPPWAATPGYYSNQNTMSPHPYAYSTPQTNSYRPVQQVNSTAPNGPVINGAQMSPMARGNAQIPAGGQKPFVPSYRLFEDLNVLGGNGDGKLRTNNNTSPGLSGTSNQSMVGGRK